MIPLAAEHFNKFRLFLFRTFRRASSVLRHMTTQQPLVTPSAGVLHVHDVVFSIFLSLTLGFVTGGGVVLLQHYATSLVSLLQHELELEDAKFCNNEATSDILLSQEFSFGVFVFVFGLDFGLVSVEHGLSVPHPP